MLSRVRIMFVSVKYKIIYRRQCLIKVQKTIRMYLAKKKFQHRVKGLSKINGLKVRLFLYIVSHIGIMRSFF